MIQKNNIAFFDFCDTLVNFQTADAFIKYIRDHYGNKRMNRLEKIRYILEKLQIIRFASIIFPKASLNKRLVLFQTKGFAYEKLDKYAYEYYMHIIKPNLIKEVMDELIFLQNNGWRIVVASGGYEIYLKYFAKDYNIFIDDIISVKIRFRENISTGEFDGGDRVWDKLEKLKLSFDRHAINSIAYSDSISDLPMLKWANKGVVISKGTSKKWPRENGFREIVY